MRSCSPHPSVKVPTSISPDEKVLLFTRSINSLHFGRDIWTLPLSGERGSRFRYVQDTV